MEEDNKPISKTEPIDIPKKKKTQDVKEYIKQEKLDKKRKEKHICECSGKYTTSGKYLHCQTKKHKNYLDNLL